MKVKKAVMDVLRCVLQIATYYGIQAELETTIQQSYATKLAEGLIDK